jgi:NAD(P)-dependent dehydrogenase (short-subunit alcohol dehydrogenase family)
MFVHGLRAHLAASRLTVPLMLSRKRGLIVSTIAWAQGKYLRHLYYDVAKNAVARMAYGMALELKSHGIAALALAPGFVRTERVMAAHAARPFDLSATESPEYIGRAAAYLLADPDVLRHTGQVLTAGQLAREYQFTDVDGRQPAAFEMPSSMALD